MDQKLFDHVMEQLRGRATSDMVAFHALAIIEAFQRGEDPLVAAPKLDSQGEMARAKHSKVFRDQEPEAPAEHPKKGRKK